MTPLFSFPFYGHLVSELFITTHGFLSLSPRLHDYIYKTQYIAPLRVKVCCGPEVLLTLTDDRRISVGSQQVQQLHHLCAELARQADGGVEQRLRDGRG